MYLNLYRNDYVFKINKLWRLPNVPLVILIFFFTVTFPILSYSTDKNSSDEIKTVTVSGLGELTGSVPMARDAAIKDGLRKSVEQAVGTFVESESMVKNFELLNDQIYTRSSGYVSSYKVLEEGELGKDLYKVKIEAQVAKGAIKNDLRALGLLHRKVGMPRVLFMIAEQNIGEEFYTTWWLGKPEYNVQTIDMDIAENTLKEEFSAKGFNVVDHSIKGANSDSVEIAKAYKVVNNDEANSVKYFGSAYGAEVVVKGKSLAKVGPKREGSNISPYFADVSLSAFRVDDGALLGAVTTSGAKRHVSPVSGGNDAIKDASIKAATSLIDQIAKKWSSASQLITVKMVNVSGYAAVSKIKNKLQSIKGVSQVYQKSFDGVVAEFQVDTDLKGSDLAEKLNKFRKELSIEVTGSTMNTVEVKFK